MEQDLLSKILMQQKAVAVVPPSLSKSPVCWNCRAAFTEQAEWNAFCPSCGKLQDYPTQGMNHFQIFSLPELLNVDKVRLQEHYFKLSKQLHPDRFASAKHPEPQYAQRWTTALNRAYQTLKNDELLAEYVLSLYPCEKQVKSSVPLELAETYFELQDEACDPKMLLNFKTELEAQLENCDLDWKTISQGWTETATQTRPVDKLKALIDRKRYISSMLSDIDRKLEK